MRSGARALVIVALALAGYPRPASAQIPEGPYVGAAGRLTIAGELAATASPEDTQTFFNYTDYEHDALRTVRGRLLGEWRFARQVALLGELRVENKDRIEAAALFVRWRPWARHEFDVQVGRIPPVVGAFARRAYGRDNLVIGLPLAYQYLTSLRPDALPRTADDVLRMRARGWQPSFPLGSHAIGPGTALVNAFRWATGAEARWRSGRVDVAGAVTRGAPAVPGVFDAKVGPAWSGRVAVNAATGLTIAVSGGRGPWIHHDALAAVPETLRGHNHQTLMGTDVEYGLGRLLVRGEWIRSAFELPAVGAPFVDSPVVASSGFVEAQYRWRPRWQSGIRVERLTFSDVRGASVAGGALTPWDAPVKRIEAVMGYRVARNLEVRAGWQHNWRKGGRVTTRGIPMMQILYWY
jgi:hypothetical protein